MNKEMPMKPSQQLIKAKEAMQTKCPLVVEEVISSLARCEMVQDNCEDPIEKYFAREARHVLQDLGGQLLSLASHPNIQKIVESSSNELQEDIL